MSSSDQLISDAPGDKKISFKGLEKCLEAFTSGEGRVVRKYARLFSQLSGKRQEDEDGTISWSSSDEDNGNTSLHNTSFGQRSKVIRKLNSQINFESRISAKKNGRRLTRAEFSRSGGHLLQDPFSLCSGTVSTNKTSGQSLLSQPEDSQAVFNAAILVDDSQDLTVGSRAGNDMQSPPTTRRGNLTANYGITSPVFKLKSSINQRVKKRRPKCRRNNEADKLDESSGDRFKTFCVPVPEPLPTVNNSLVNSRDSGMQLTPESKAIDEKYAVTSPILGRMVTNRHAIASSPIANGAGDPSVSPIMLKSLRRKRRRNITVKVPASPILEPKNKAFKRKRRKLGLIKENSQSCDVKTHAVGLGIVELFPSPTHSERPVKRSLDFTVENKKDVLNRTNAKLVVSVELENMPGTATDHAEKIGENVPKPLWHNFVEQANFSEEGASQGFLNATNQIEEVNSEELNLSVVPRAVFHRPNRLSLRSTVSKSTKIGVASPCLETIEEDSQIRSEITERRVSIDSAVSAKVAKRSAGERNVVPSQKPVNLDQTNLIEEVYTEDLNLSMVVKPSITEETCVLGDLSRNDEKANLIHIDENSPTEGVACSLSVLDDHGIDTDRPLSKIVPKTVREASEEMHKELRTNRTTRSYDRELIISQSSSRSGNQLKSSQPSFLEIENVSSPISRVNLDTHGPGNGMISTSNPTRSPGVSSPLVISSAGSSPVVKAPDVPFVILEDEYNAPPKRRRKKLDPNGIASRLQRLLNQRRSAARIWQYKCSKLSRTSHKEEEKPIEECRGRVLKVCSVRTDYSHVVLFSKESKETQSNGKEFRGSVLVVLDPGVVVRLAKVMNAKKIKIFPPWQAMDYVDHDITVILGANIVEVLSTERDPHSPCDNTKKSTSIQKYTCRCLPPPAPDAEVLECWDGVQWVGVFDLLFPVAAPTSTQLVQFNENMLPTLDCPVPNNLKCKRAKYSIQALLSTQSTASHGKGVLALTILRVLCYRQRSFGLSSRTDTSLYWSVFGRDDSNEVCELVLGQLQNPDAEMRYDWSDFISGGSLGKKYKFRGVVVNQRLDRSRLSGEWDILPEKQNIVYILAPSNQFSFSIEESASDSTQWESEISSLDLFIGDEAKESGLNKPLRVSFVCRIFHANDHTLYVADQSVSPKLCSVVTRQSAFIPPSIVNAVQKPSPTRVIVLLQDVEASKGKIVADKYSRIVVLDECGRAYPEGSGRKSWPASPESCSNLRGIKVQLPHFSTGSRTHDLVKLTGFVSDLDETSALMWPACGSCGSPVTTKMKNVHHCTQCATECNQLIVRMSLVVFVKCPDVPNDVSIRVKILHKTVQALLRTLPQEDQDIRVREALGKPIGPIRCEVAASHGGNFVLNELPSSLWM